MSEESNLITKTLGLAKISTLHTKDGKKITVKEPIGEIFLAGIAICDGNPMLAPLCQAMLCVAKIDDELVVPPTDYKKVKELSNRLGFAGIITVTNWFNEHLNHELSTEETKND